ncbi:MAG: hypothetical protein MUF49_29765 [Oculatellaceae cyanobacterium Prado106]|jgi:hypothetical protein|nr:hypothetical protein [Oculatellaceae cyanobacterium Prado106]
MIQVKTFKQIATSRTIASFRAIQSLTRTPSQGIDRGRIVTGYGQMVNYEIRRQRRNSPS